MPRTRYFFGSRRSAAAGSALPAPCPSDVACRSGSRSSDARLSRTPAPPGSRSSARAASSSAIIADENELVVVRVEQLAARPGNLGHAFGHLRAAQGVGLGIFAGDGVELPAGLRHRLHADDAGRQPHADRGGGRAVAAVRHAQHRLVRTHRPAPPGVRAVTMGGCCREAGEGAGGADDKLDEALEFS